MKKTLRIMGLCALVTIAATSCQKNEEQLTNSITAELTQPNTDAKTYIGTGNYLMWNSGDQIKVYDATGASHLFTTTNHDVVQTTFVSNDQIDPNAAYCAFYPAANSSDLTGGYVYLTLNANQTFANGSFAPNTYPIAAYNGGSGTAFTFHSPCGVLAIPLTGNCTIGSIEITGNRGEALAGQLRVNPVGFDPLNPTNFTLVNPVTTITLTCPGGLTLSSTPQTCVFVTRMGAFTQGFTVVVKGTDNSVITTLTTTHNNMILPEFIRLMPVVNIQ